METTTEQLEVLYFGCRHKGIAGHDLYSKKRHVSFRKDHPYGVALDGGYIGRDSNQTWIRQPGWTGVTFVDQSGDSRPGSNSAFLVNAEVSDKELVALAKAQWPEIFSRPGFPGIKIE